MLHKVLIANRGAIAVRILRTLKSMGLKSVAIYAEADADAPHVRLADESFSLGEGTASQTYLNQQKILAIVERCGVHAVHPGYGFLSENAEFCQALEQRGVLFIGPTAEQMTLFGLKHQARELAQNNGVPLSPGTGLLDDLQQAVIQADRIGYPVMLKSTAGGGGIGMQICRDEQQLRQCWDSIIRLSENNFANAGVFVEKYIEYARHIEVQVFGDGAGQALILGDRDCSAQRRHQKVIEEAPAPNIPDKVRAQLHQVAQQLVEGVNYRNAGTVEFIYDQNSDEFYFLEMNTRLQVEHGVTEQIYGVDIVRWMLELAFGELPPLATLQKRLTIRGHAIQARIYAENPLKDFQPCAGLLNHVIWPQGSSELPVRVDHWVESGSNVSALFDPMLGKVICWAEDRDAAIKSLEYALQETVLDGIETNRDYVLNVLACAPLRNGTMYTRYLSQFDYQPTVCDVLHAGTLTSIQDFPGRLGFWDVGVPPSGPFDDWAFRLGNRLLENDQDAAGLEITMTGPTLKFHAATQIVLTGADMQAKLNGESVDRYQVLDVTAGSQLKINKVHGAGARAFLLIRGGFQCQPYLNSRATFALGQFGGQHGRALRTGDVLHYLAHEPVTVQRLPETLIPQLTDHWHIRVIYGPHGAPDFFTEQDIEQFFAAHWKVHYNSSRTGIRLVGPKPQWARSDGGEAGMHPSNIHDNAYAVGSIDFTGDMPVILGPDGPSLGGFVCPVTVIVADMWKLGQLRAGDTVSFEAVGQDTAVALLKAQGDVLANLSGNLEPVSSKEFMGSPVLRELDKALFGETVIYRAQGENNVLIEYGPHQLDIALRFRVHAFMLKLDEQLNSAAHLKSAFLDITPGVRSLQIHYDPLQINQSELLDFLQSIEAQLTELDEMSVPSRIVHLPLSWNDAACRLAVEKYMQSVRKDAPWCPDNIEFIRRINGLESVDAVKDIVFNARYVVMGLGDVYLGAPVATPLDPRHRLVTTKYNPARTWTAENSVGIGGSYMCIYGMEGPGGYQFVGRTLQMWNRYKVTQEFEKPWLLRFFDQIQFYEVEADELTTIRKQFPHGRYPITIEQTEFSLKSYREFLTSHSESINEFVSHRNQAFQEELDRWVASGQINYQHNDSSAEDISEKTDTPDGCEAVESPVAGNIWRVMINDGDSVHEGQVVCILESMKMEIEITSHCSGVVNKVLLVQGQSVQVGQHLVFVQPSDS